MFMNPITKLSVTYNVAIITIDNLPVNYDLISDIFNTIATKNINVDMITQSPPLKGIINLSFSISSKDLVTAISSLNSYKKKIPSLSIQVDADNTKISVFGNQMRELPGVAARLFTLLANNNIEIKMVTTSEVDISCLIFDKDADKAINSIKKEFNLQEVDMN
ncbi:MAG TPA: ACT domain-containing protein [Clostridiaceae bacterium]|nr:ACT domain-containing protein [Clostridiaceae bacterium]